MDRITINEEVLVKLTSKYAKKYGNLPSTHKQAIQFAYEQGKVDAMKEVINNIPCKKNCNVCLRNGMTSCYEPDENYVANELFEKITTMIQQAN